MLMRAEASVSELIMIIGAMLIGFVTLFVVSNMLTGSAKASIAIEQSSIAFYITSSANALSLVDEGSVEMEFEDTYDMVVEHKGILNPGYYLTITYKDESGDEHEVERIFLADVEETSLSSVDGVCVTKSPDRSVEVKREC